MHKIETDGMVYWELTVGQFAYRLEILQVYWALDRISFLLLFRRAYVSPYSTPAEGTP